MARKTKSPEARELSLERRNADRERTLARRSQRYVKTVTATALTFTADVYETSLSIDALFALDRLERAFA